MVLHAASVDSSSLAMFRDGVNAGHMPIKMVKMACAPEFLLFPGASPNEFVYAGPMSQEAWRRMRIIAEDLMPNFPSDHRQSGTNSIYAEFGQSTELLWDLHSTQIEPACDYDAMQWMHRHTAAYLSSRIAQPKWANALLY